MDGVARFFISELMTSRLPKGYLFYKPRVDCNEFTINGNVRLRTARADVSLM